MDPAQAEYEKLPLEVKEAVELGHQPSTIDFAAARRFILWFVGGLVVVHVLIYLMLIWFNLFAAPLVASPSALARERTGPPAPRLQSAPIRDLQAMHDAENGAFARMGWLSAPTNEVRVPDGVAEQVIRLSSKAPARVPQTQPGPAEQNGGEVPRVLRQRERQQ